MLEKPKEMQKDMKTKGEMSQIYTAVHSLDLHLQAALRR